MLFVSHLLYRYSNAADEAAEYLGLPNDMQIRIPAHNNDQENYWKATLLPAVGKLRRGLDQCWNDMFPAIVRSTAAACGETIDGCAISLLVMVI